MNTTSTTMNTPKCVRLQNIGDIKQYYAMVKKKKKKKAALVKKKKKLCLVMHAKWGKIALGLNAMVVQYLHAYCEAVHSVYESNDHASATLLPGFVANENCAHYRRAAISRLTGTMWHISRKISCSGLLNWSYPHFLVYCCCHSSANTLLPP